MWPPGRRRSGRSPAPSSFRPGSAGRRPPSRGAGLGGRIEDVAAWSPQEWPVAGPIVFQARLSGTPSAFEGGGQVEVREFRIGGERFEALRAALAFKGAGV